MALKVKAKETLQSVNTTRGLTDYDAASPLYRFNDALIGNPLTSALLFNLFLFSRPSRHLVEDGGDISNIDNTVAVCVVGIAIAAGNELHSRHVAVRITLLRGIDLDGISGRHVYIVANTVFILRCGNTIMERHVLCLAVEV